MSHTHPDAAEIIGPVDTTIYAKMRRRIARVCANDAELVEYDRSLFVIDTCPRRPAAYRAAG